jgi:hypothetical protein
MHTLFSKAELTDVMTRLILPVAKLEGSTQDDEIE